MISNTTGQEPKRHDRQIQDMFSGIAGVYDRMNGLLSLGQDERWRKALAARIDPGAEDLLDACCGTGELILTAKAAGRGQRFVAGDFCEPMLRAGVKDNGLAAEAAVLAADTQKLPFASGSFDAAMVGFGLRNLGVLEEGLAELHRVLRPGGQLLVLEFFRVHRAWLARPIEWYLSRAVPLLGKLVGRDQAAYTYLPQSMGRFVSVPEFRKLLEDNGFEANIETRPQTMGIAHLIVARKAGN